MKKMIPKHLRGEPPLYGKCQGCGVFHWWESRDTYEKTNHLCPVCVVKNAKEKMQ